MHRDIAERRKLLELAGDYPAPVLALTDGPVELWGAKNGGEDDYRKNLEIHKSVLSQLQAKNVTVAGYVDKPGADLVVRTLEIAQFSSPEDFKNIRKLHPLRGVTDRWLYSFLPGWTSFGGLWAAIQFTRPLHRGPKPALFLSECRRRRIIPGWCGWKSRAGWRKMLANSISCISPCSSNAG